MQKFCSKILLLSIWENIQNYKINAIYPYYFSYRQQNNCTFFNKTGMQYYKLYCYLAEAWICIFCLSKSVSFSFILYVLIKMNVYSPILRICTIQGNSLSRTFWPPWIFFIKTVPVEQASFSGRSFKLVCVSTSG